jgi:hypothetical protein
MVFAERKHGCAKSQATRSSRTQWISELVLAAFALSGCLSERENAPVTSRQIGHAIAMPGRAVEIRNPGGRSTVTTTETGLASVKTASDAGNWTRCYEHFEPRSEIGLDVMRLALLCGPSNGMRKFISIDRTELNALQRNEHAFSAVAGDCFRVFAVANTAVRDLDVQIVDSLSRTLAGDDGDSRWLVLNEQAPFCVAQAGEYRALVSAEPSDRDERGLDRAGRASYALAIWRLRH